MVKQAMEKAADTVSTPASGEAKTRDADIVRRGNAYFIDPTLIDRREGWNPRFDFGEIEELARSIKHQLEVDPKSGGLLNDIRVKRKEGGRFELVDGDRRLTAIELLMKKGTSFPDGIPAKIETKGQSDVALLIKMFEANSGKPFTPLEEAAAYKRMQDAGMTIKQMVKAVGRSDVHIIEVLALLTADDSVKEALKDGTIGKTHARQIAVHARGDKAKQQELVAKAKAAKSGTGDKAKLKDDIEAARVAKNAKKGRTLKMRALSDTQLSELGAKVALDMTAKMKDAKKPADFNVRAWIKKDDMLALAFTFGALEALKASAGAKVELSI